MRRLLLLVAGGVLASAVLLLWSPGAHGAPCDGASRTWDGGAGTSSWSDPANWTGDVLPGPDDRVCIDEPATTTVTVSGTQVVAALESRSGLAITGSLTLDDPDETSIIRSGSLTGSLGGAGDVVVTGGLAWSGGVMAGTGTTTIAEGGSLSLVEGSPRLSGRSLVNEGEVVWGATVFYLHQGAVVSNLGDWEATGGGTMAYWAEPEGVFRNGAGGTLSRTGEEGSTSSVTVDFVNQGAVVVAGGELRLSGGDGDGEQSGGFAGSGGAVRFSGGEWDLGEGTSFTGVTDLQGGTYTAVAGAVVPFEGETRLTGRLTGPGDVVLAGALRWNQVLMDGPGRTVVAAGSSLDVTGSGYLRERTWVNRGVLDLPADGFIASWDGTPALVHNAEGGTVRKDGSGTFAISGEVGFDNDGVVEVAGGELNLSGGDGAQEQSGTYDSTGTGVVRFSNGEWDLGPGTTYPGTVRVTGGEHTVPPGAIVELSGQTAWEAGTLGGAGDVVVTGGLAWSGGVMAGTGTTTIAEGATLTLPSGSPRLTGGRELETRGDVAWATTMYVDNGSTITNAGTWDSATGGSVESWDGTLGLFHNKASGTVRSAGSSSVGSRFDNDGTVEVAGGTLRLRQSMNHPGTSSALTGGTWRVLGGELELPGPAIEVNAATVVLDGPGAALNAGNVPLGQQLVRNAAAGRITLSGGQALQAGATLRNDGRVTLAGGTLAVGGTYRQASGTTSLGGAGTLAADVRLDGGSLVGAGTVDGDLVQDGGRLSPAGTVSVTGALVMGPGATYVADVAPATNDTVAVAGAVTLGGTLVVRAAASYQPPAGTTHRIVESGAPTGAFATVQGAGIVDGRFYDVVADPDGVRLEVLAPSFQLAAYADATRRETRALGDPCTIRGTNGRDVIRTTAGDDVVCGFGGDDTIIASGGHDHYIGGRGRDTVTFRGTGQATDADLRRRVGTAGTDGFGLAGVESLVGGSGADRLAGTARADRLRGGAGPDRLLGRGGDDVLVGGRGDDVVHGASGTDRCVGGRGRNSFLACET